MEGKNNTEQYLVVTFLTKRKVNASFVSSIPITICILEFALVC